MSVRRSALGEGFKPLALICASRKASIGLLVQPGDTDGLADALVRVLDERELAERLGAGAHSSAGLWTVSPEDFASRLRDLVGRITGLS